MLPENIVLRGQKVNLLDFGPEDITVDYISWLNDIEVVRYSNQRLIRHTEQSCRDYLRSFAGTPSRFLKIVMADSGKTVGTMTAYAVPAHQTVDMGILLGARTVWGQGIGRDAWETLLHWLICTVGVRKVTAGAMRCNVAMVRIMEGSGMKLEAVRRGQELLEGVAQDLVYYGIFRDD